MSYNPTITRWVYIDLTMPGRQGEQFVYGHHVLFETDSIRKILRSGWIKRGYKECKVLLYEI